MTRWLRQGLLDARVRMIRHHRTLRRQPLLLLFEFVVAAAGTIVAVGHLPIEGYAEFWSVPGTYVYGTRVGADGGEAVLAATREFSAMLFIVMVYGVLLQEAAAGGVVKRHVDDLLLVATPEAIAFGEVLASAAFNGRLVGVVVLIGSVAFGIGANAPLAVVPMLIAGVALVLTAVAIAYPVAIATELLFLRFKGLRGYKPLFGGALVVAVGVAIRWYRESVALLVPLPVSWYADAGLATSVPEASMVRGVAVLLTTPVAVVMGTAVTARLGRRLWLAEDPPTAQGLPASEPSLVGRLLDRFVSRPVAAVTRATWLRFRREPRALLYVALVVVLLVIAGREVADRVPDAAPFVVALYGAVAVGAGATLNPLGNEGPMLPHTLTTPEGARNLLLGYALSVAVPGGIIVGTGTFAIGFLAPVGPLEQVGIAVLGVVLGVTAPVVSLGIGVALPQFEGFRPVASSGVQTPRLAALVVLTLVMVAIGTPALLGLYASVGTPVPAGPPWVPTAAGVALTVLAASITGWISFRYALARVDGYQLGASGSPG